MAKIQAFIITTIVLVLLFNFAGLISGTATSYVLGHMNLIEPQNFKETNFYTLTYAITGIVVGATTVIGLLAGASASMALLAPVLAIGGALFLLSGDIVAIFNVFYGINEIFGMFAILVFSPILVGYVMTVVEWIRGMST